ncbi:MAG: ABC transporter substrate-binding protein, partial [Candidatus Binatia bacterium]
PPSTDAALAMGGKVLARAADYFPDWPLTCGWSRRSWVESHRDLVVRFIRAWATATDWILAPGNREETLEILVKEQRLSLDSADNSLKRMVPKARIHPLSLRRVLEIRIETGLYHPPFSPAEHFYDAQYWCEATGLPAPEPAGFPSVSS